MDKINLYTQCVQKLQEQINDIKDAILKVQESIEGEQGSTAGNKFETARAMGQGELDRLNGQLFKLNLEMNILQQIDAVKPCKSAQLGAIINTEKKSIYLCVGLGKFELNKAIIYAISIQSPLGQAVIGKGVGDEIILGETIEKILSIH
jgi:hypothetical protein